MNDSKLFYEKSLERFNGRDITTVTDSEANAICNALWFLGNEYYDCTYSEPEDIYNAFIEFRENVRKNPANYDDDCMEYFINVCLENDLMCSENSRDDGKNYSVIHNSKFNSEEVMFFSKPSEAVRDALKALHFRWNKKTGLWYGFADPKEIIAAIDSADSPLVIPEFETTEIGTIYEGWRGGNNESWSCYDELKKLLQADFKKAGIKATIRKRPSGYLTSIGVTISITSADFIPVEDYINSSDVGIGFNWIYYTDNENEIKSVYRDSVYNLPEYKIDPDAFIRNVKTTDYNLKKSRIENGYAVSKHDIDILNNSSQSKYFLAVKIVASYNRDNSDLYTDYFDRDIYEDFSFKVS